ncbi:SDR family oxidoreductase [Hazenella sp. IB182357]|uniref:SDR family oxidoreductase n=1 Tax=Polycladospora coralii TaxID=2771432 RepID=A0A926NBC8_9BACL|nr:SDR family oxidoreductase [Polycladospora coralii]MBD1373077.1 SDR family oxidoreductase [Polycladospora coralii]MBS7529577.1 SDR family oxidoreductase [Polycladospora coralii]
MKKTALITGASSGLGKAYAYRLASMGHNLILVARSTDKLEALANDLNNQFQITSYVIPIDLSEAYAAKKLYHELNERSLHVDILVNNAGVGASGPFIDHTFEENHRMVMLNITTLMELTHLLLPAMVKKGYGDVINVASLMSFFSSPYMSVYAASKAFVLSFSEGISREYMSQGIRVIAICPGTTDTNFFAQAPLDIKQREFRTPEQVVDSTFRALDRGKSHTVDGLSNTLLTLLPRLLPRKLLTAIFGTAMKKKTSQS